MRKIAEMRIYNPDRQGTALYLGGTREAMGEGETQSASLAPEGEKRNLIKKYQLMQERNNIRNENDRVIGIRIETQKKRKRSQ